MSTCEGAGRTVADAGDFRRMPAAPGGEFLPGEAGVLTQVREPHGGRLAGRFGPDDLDELAAASLAQSGRGSVALREPVDGGVVQARPRTRLRSGWNWVSRPDAVGLAGQVPFETEQHGQLGCLILAADLSPGDAIAVKAMPENVGSEGASGPDGRVQAGRCLGGGCGCRAVRPGCVVRQLRGGM
jgi:hypothetical protein